MVGYQLDDSTSLDGKWLFRVPGDFKVWEVLKWAILKLQKAQMIINAKGLLARPSNIWQGHKSDAMFSLFQTDGQEFRCESWEQSQQLDEHRASQSERSQHVKFVVSYGRHLRTKFRILDMKINVWNGFYRARQFARQSRIAATQEQNGGYHDHWSG